MKTLIQLEKILIVCEDKKSSVLYLEAKARSVGVPIKSIKKVENIKESSSNENTNYIHGAGKDPSKVVEKAITFKNELNLQQKRKKSYCFSKVYCVIDVDDHVKLEPALKLIKEENKKDKETEIIPIVSNECFEVWYILHFEYTTRNLYRNTKAKRSTNKEFISEDNNLSKLIEKYLGIKDYEKGDSKIFSLLQTKGNESNAIQYAEKLEKHYLETNDINSNEVVYKFNPSTQVYKLIIKLNELNYSKPEIQFEELKNSDKLIFKNQDNDLIAKLWDILFKEYDNLDYSERLLMLREIFEKPYFNVRHKNDTINDLLSDHELSLP